MPDLGARLAGIPAWQYGAIATIGVFAIVAFRRHATPAARAAASKGPDYIVVETPQTVTPYDLPVTRTRSAASVLT